METIASPAAPEAIGPYSQAIKSCGFLFCSGQLGVDPKTNSLAPGGFAGQMHQALKNISSILAVENIVLSNVIKTTVFLTSMDDFKAMNEMYSQYFGEHKPARSAMQVTALPRHASVEIECIAELS
jgi:2-iminobutanoate/2-iminopropanoate deaminase